MSTWGIFELIISDAKRIKCNCGHVFIPYMIESICPEFCQPEYLKLIYTMLEKKTIRPIVDIIVSYLHHVRPNISISTGYSYMVSSPDIKHVKYSS